MVGPPFRPLAWITPFILHCLFYTVSQIPILERPEVNFTMPKLI